MRKKTWRIVMQCPCLASAAPARRGVHSAVEAPGIHPAAEQEGDLNMSDPAKLPPPPNRHGTPVRFPPSGEDCKVAANRAFRVRNVLDAHRDVDYSGRRIGNGQRGRPAPVQVERVDNAIVVGQQLGDLRYAHWPQKRRRTWLANHLAWIPTAHGPGCRIQPGQERKM